MKIVSCKAFARTAAFFTAVIMLLSAAACSGETDPVSSESSLKEVRTDELDRDLKDMLIRFTDWYEVEEGQDPVYDSATAGDGETNILRSILGDAGCADWSQYPVNGPKEVYNAKKLDPKKWAKESGGAYMVFNSDDADWIAIHIFNATEKDIEAMRAQGEENEWFYFKDGKYYKTIGGVGDPFTEYTFDSAKTDGTVYTVTYSCSVYNGEDYTPNGTYTAEMQKKTVDGKDYWTLLKFELTDDSE